MSVMLHCGAIALLLAACAHYQSRPASEAMAARTVPLIAPYLPDHHGGGGSGDRSPLPASLGRLPRIALRQYTPPLTVLSNTNPVLAVEPTIIAPPDAQLPQPNLADLGDPFGRLGPKSNGTGIGGSVGDGSGTGLGPGKGPGIGPGEGGDYGGGIHTGRLGGPTIGPVLLFKIEPEFSEEARKAKLQGEVILSAEVGLDGKLRNVRILQSLGLGLDEKAIEAVQQWRFRPAYRSGRPVVAAATIEVTFHLL